MNKGSELMKSRNKMVAIANFSIIKALSGATLLSALTLLSGFAMFQVHATTISVLQDNGEPAVGVVVIVENASTSGIAGTADEMGQRDRQFDPNILVVQKGATVTFPNYDNIKHHIYSFSSVKIFEQELYKGTESTPVVFEKTGVVELGCNVHDWMLGYIYIADTPYFGTANESGDVTIAGLSDGEYQVTVWHPRIDNADNRVTQTLALTASGSEQISLGVALLSGESDDVDFDFDDY